MPPRNRARADFAAAEATPGCPLPVELLLEIFARSDAATLIGCSATCRSLRRDIVRPAFINRVCHNGPGAAVPPRLLGFLRLDLGRAPMSPPSFYLAHPATPATASLSAMHLASALGADADRLAAGYHYRTLTSRDGLVLLRRMWWNMKQKKMTMSSMCVFDPMTGKGTFFPGPPDSGAGQGHGPGHDSYYHDKFVLLTAADGVGCPFLVLSANFSVFLGNDSRSVTVRTFSPSSGSEYDGAWSRATLANHSPPTDKTPLDNAAVVYGGFVYWIMYGVYSIDNYIFSYNVLTAASGSIELPPEVPDYCRAYRNLHLASSSSGRRLSLLVTDKFKVTVWLLMSSGDGGGACWARSAVIDTKGTMCAAFELRRYPYHYGHWPNDVAVVSSRARSGVVLLLPYRHLRLESVRYYEDLGEEFIVLDLETEEMRTVIKEKGAFLYEVDLASQLSAMKSF